MVMPQFPGFPSNDFDFHFEEAGGALAGLLLRDLSGNVIPGVLPASDRILSAGSGWTLRVAPFVAVRSKGRAVLIGGTTEEVILDVDPAPSANARIDVVYSLPADVGAGDPPVGVAYAKGTPGAVPSKPSIPQGAVELGTLRLSAGQSSAASGSLVEEFKFASLTGGEIRVRSKSDLNPLNVLVGTRAYVVSEGLSYRKSASAWVSESVPDTGWKILTLLTGGGSLKWRCRDSKVEIRWIGGPGSYPSGQTNLASSGSIPLEYRPDVNIRGTGALNGDARACLYAGPTGGVGLLNSTGSTKTGGEGQCFYFI